MKEALWKRVWELDRLEEIPIYGLGPGRYRAVGSHRKGGGLAALQGAWRLSRPHSGLCQHRHFRHHRGIPGHRRPVPGGRVPRDQAPRLGRPEGRRETGAGAACPCGTGHRADVRRLGRLRPARCDLRRARARRGRVPLVRGADARVQHRCLPSTARQGRDPAALGRDVRRRALQHRRFHRPGCLRPRPHQHPLQGWRDRGDADRPSRGVVQYAGRGPWRWFGEPRDRLCDPEYDLLRIAGYHQSDHR